MDYYSKRGDHVNALVLQHRNFSMASPSTNALMIHNNSLNNASAGDGGELASGPFQWSVHVTVVLGMLLSLLDLVTILGNLLVCVTIASCRRLRTICNYFIFSLALSDLLLGILVLPFSVVNTLVSSWPLGAIFCNMYVATDVMLCTVSILNLFAISLDRYFAVTRPLLYQRAALPGRVLGLICGIWIFSAAMAYLPIHLGWNTHSGDVQNLSEPWNCNFEANEVYVLLVSIGTYVIPLIIMCVVYLKVLSIARRQARAIKKLVVIYAENRRKAESTMAVHDHKATFTLASVVTAFTICWVPYFVVFTAKPFVPDDYFPPVFDLFVLWLGYANSMLNPILYAFLNSEFRYGFLWVLCRKRQTVPPGL